MDLRLYLRNDFAMYIRPLFIKSECEICGCNEGLHLHHVTHFSDILINVLKNLNLQEKEINLYTDKELKDVSCYMLSEQLKIEYKTLCLDCHKLEHSMQIKNNISKKTREEIIYNQRISDKIKQDGIDEVYIGFRLTSELKNEILSLYGFKNVNWKKFCTDIKSFGYIVKVLKNKGTYLFNIGHEIKKDCRGNLNANILDKHNKLYCLEEYLNSIKGEKLYKNSQKELAIKINFKRNGKLLKSYESINLALKENNMPYKIVVVQTDWNRTTPEGNKNLYYGKVYWIINLI